MKSFWQALRGWLLLAAIIAAGWAALHFFVLRPEPVKVSVYMARPGVVERIVANTKAGSVRSRRSADLSAEAAGRVVEILKREGERVQAGDPLLRLDDRTARALERLSKQELRAAQARVKEAQAAFRDAREEFERLHRVREKKPEAVADAEYDRAVRAKERAAAALEALQAALDVQRERVRQAEIQVDQLTLRAPFSGVIAERFIEVGEWAVPGKPLLRLLDPDRLYIRAELDEVDIGEVRQGAEVRIRLDPFRDRTFEGEITRVAPYVSEALQENRTVVVEVEFRGELDGTRLRPGISADIEVILDRTDGTTLRVPTLAILEGDRVLVAQDGLAVSRKIETGLRNWDFTEVKAGLSEGDPVIVSLDREEVRAGARIVIEERR